MLRSAASMGGRATESCVKINSLPARWRGTTTGSRSGEDRHTAADKSFSSCSRSTRSRSPGTNRSGETPNVDVHDYTKNLVFHSAFSSSCRPKKRLSSWDVIGIQHARQLILPVPGSWETYRGVMSFGLVWLDYAVISSHRSSRKTLRLIQG